MVTPSGAMATAGQRHPVRSPPVGDHVSRSHTRTVRSSEADTARRPSGVTATDLTLSSWPVSVATLSPLSRIPHPHRPVIRGRHRPPPIRRHRHGHHTSSWPVSVATLSPLSRSHTRSVRSSEADTARRPSAVTATDFTPDPRGPSASPRSRPRSPDPTPAASGHPSADTARRPSAVTATAFTQSSWPVSVATLSPRSPDPTPAASCHPTPTPPAAHPASPPRTSHHASWPVSVATLSPALQIPHPQRPVIRRRHRPPPIRRHRHGHSHQLSWPVSVATLSPLSGEHRKCPTPAASGHTTPTPPAAHPPSPPRTSPLDSWPVSVATLLSRSPDPTPAPSGQTRPTPPAAHPASPPRHHT